MSIEREKDLPSKTRELKAGPKALIELWSSGLRVSDEAVTENWLSESLRQLGTIAEHYARHATAYLRLGFQIAIIWAASGISTSP